MRKATGHVLRVMGCVWLIAVVCFLLGSLAAIAIEEGTTHGVLRGIGAALEVMSPHNGWNFIVTAVLVLPGVLLLQFAEKQLVLARGEAALRALSKAARKGGSS